MIESSHPWRRYRKLAIIEAREVERGEAVTSDVLVRPGVVPAEGDYIARRLDDPRDQWLIPRAQFHREYSHYETTRYASDVAVQQALRFADIEGD